MFPSLRKIFKLKIVKILVGLSFIFYIWNICRSKSFSTDNNQREYVDRMNNKFKPNFNKYIDTNRYGNLLSTTLPNLNQSLNSRKSWQYHCPFSRTFKGKPFYPDDSSMEALEFPLKDYIMLTDSTLKDFIFVTAISEQYVAAVIDSLATVQHYFPEKGILVYDLGITDESRKKIKSLCNVQVKIFQADLYPRHVQHLYLYSWKPLIVHDALKHQTGIFWIDSSVRFKSGNMTEVYKDVKASHGILLFRNTGHSNYAVTHSQMYHYIPSRPAEMQRIEQKEANSILIYRTREVYTGVMIWWTLCALERKCMCPTENRFCHFEKSYWTNYANCHRFDQSAINILLANYFNFDEKYYKCKHEVIDIERVSLAEAKIKPKLCEIKL